ncbi:Fur-regulated basic protein FbpA [Heyndrickxia camelliae]|uniref:Fur-regulated basic protein FbpA n=1 Tax=Heyndrickxia camelliae TaxID=1707093 RepID=A0A2N3LJE3_9BACI|nr:Fur-regulated basic protein FbpA [Heyndrickxia camelliae]PKR84707.1 Fur-regulated basic protein FbpA [Heyndrickxia camelliae]
MGKLLKDAVEARRNELINKLIELEQFKKNDKHLFELTLSDLEHEYFKIQSQNHPHCGFDSIRWKNFH